MAEETQGEDGPGYLDLKDLPPKWQRYFEHPDPCPETLEPMPYLIHPPGRNAATRSWIDFRDRTVLPMIEVHPDDANLPRFLARAEEILAWREKIRPEERFWKPD